MNENPLLHIGFPLAFDKIRAEHVEPGIRQLLDECEGSLNGLALLHGSPTWDNILRSLDALTERLEAASGVVKHLTLVANTPELRQAHHAVEPETAAFFSRILLHEGAWRVLKQYAETPEARSLTGTRRRYLHKTLDAFRRHGADLDAERKAALEKLDVELAQVTTQFGENVLDSTNTFEHVVTTEEGLAGLPQSAVVAARESAETKGIRGWRFTLQQPSYLAVMTYLDDQRVREFFYRAYNQRAARAPFDNSRSLVRILELRKEKAGLLGYRDFADFILEDRMAVTGARALEFLENLQRRTEPYFRRENEELLAFRRHLEGPGAPSLQPWDVPYYAEKLRKAKYDIDEEMLRPYFPLEAVLNGMFEIAARLFGIRVEQEANVPVWDPQVRYFRILDADGALLGGFYTDWFPRENKRGGAWMDALLTGVPIDGRFGPHAGVICGNLTPPSGGKPALLTHRDVETIFHEFGHLLHHCLSRVEVRGLAGTNVAQDFVELPSQIMENWCWEREALDLFARHWETGETIPEDLFQRMKRARTFRAANAMMRQLGFGFVDLAVHREYDPARHGELAAYGREIMSRFSPAPLPADHAMLNAFTHLFASPVGYAAAYYSYKWAEVLDADAFTVFRREGIFSREAGMRFREGILARGDSEDPSVLVESFLGRPADASALLERSGLV